jgi:CheY-like chemotaxis protein
VHVRGPDCRRRVLIIAADDFGRETLGQILEADGLSVLRASSGDEALGLLRREPHLGLIVLDLCVPSLSGWPLVRRQQSQLGRRDIPVIVLSPDTSGCYRGPAGVVAQFEKPVPVGALLALIRRHLPPG